MLMEPALAARGAPMAGRGFASQSGAQYPKVPGEAQQERTMKISAFAIRLFALGLSATTPARADLPWSNSVVGTVRSGGTAPIIRGATAGRRLRLACPIGQRPRSRSKMPRRKISVRSAACLLSCRAAAKSCSKEADVCLGACTCTFGVQRRANRQRRAKLHAR